MSPDGLKIRPGTGEDASRPELVSRVVANVNESYSFGESGLWVGGAARTDEAEVRAMMEAGKMLLLVGCREGWRGEEVVGGVAVDVGEEGGGCGELGMLHVAEAYRTRSGAGRALVEAAEARCREAGCSAIKLQILTPTDFKHPVKEWLEVWYTAMGYVKQTCDVTDFGKAYPHIAPLLSAPCSLVDFMKKL